ncbi:hypothetical protein AEQU2_00663 [Aequorivita lipolytica]|nr:hypothetical protein AEQU2_00663 [Aequorivita lipolytica]
MEFPFFNGRYILKFYLDKRQTKKCPIQCECKSPICLLFASPNIFLKQTQIHQLQNAIIMLSVLKVKQKNVNQQKKIQNRLPPSINHQPSTINPFVYRSYFSVGGIN